DRPPKVIKEFPVPVGDNRVGDAHIEQSEQSCIPGEGEPLGRRELARCRLPSGGEILGRPEFHGGSLLDRSRDALGAAQVFRLVVVAGVESARQWRWRAWPELIGALQHPWF